MLPNDPASAYHEHHVGRHPIQGIGEAGGSVPPGWGAPKAVCGQLQPRRMAAERRAAVHRMLLLFALLKTAAGTLRITLPEAPEKPLTGASPAWIPRRGPARARPGFTRRIGGRPGKMSGRHPVARAGARRRRPAYVAAKWSVLSDAVRTALVGAFPSAHVIERPNDKLLHSIASMPTGIRSPSLPRRRQASREQS